jgi:hypothetical protein
MLLAGYVLVVALGYASSKVFPLPDNVKALPPRFTPLGGTRPSPLFFVYLTFAFLAFGLGIVGLVGLFCLWRPAPWLFAAGIVAQMMPAVPWYAMTAFDKFLLELQLFLAGVISAITLLGPAKDLFA